MSLSATVSEKANLISASADKLTPVIIWRYRNK